MKIQEFNSNHTGFRPSEEEVLEFLHTVPLGVVSTLNPDGSIGSATVGFSEHPGLEFTIGTAESSRKSQNLQLNPAVSYVATDVEKRYTVQFQGAARKLTDAEFSKYAVKHFEKLPASAPFRNIQGQCYFLLTPTWVRFSDCNPYPWITTEFTF